MVQGSIARIAHVIAALATTAVANIVTLDQLVDNINSGGNKKVGFLSEANFQSVHNVLPDDTEPVYCDGSDSTITCTSTEDMINLIREGTLLAGLISGLPNDEQAPHLNVFSSTVVSTRAMFMAPVQSLDHPHGTTNAAHSSTDLSFAVDAAIVSLQQQGKDEEIRAQNMPFEFIAVHTCKGSDLSAFVVPDAFAATGLLRTVLDNKVLKVGSLGPYNWGGNDGDYTVDPPVGFYPDWFNEFCEQFNALSGPDGVRYDAGGAIICQRVWQLSSTAVFRDLFDGVSHVTEPYYVVDAFYTGTGETCTAATEATDCRPARTLSGTESCSADGVCSHPTSPRTRHFRTSCSTLGVDSTFMTRREDRAMSETSNEDDGVNATLVVALAAIGIIAVALAVLAVVMVRREKSGNPLFQPLHDKPAQRSSPEESEADIVEGNDRQARAASETAEKDPVAETVGALEQV